MNYIYDKGTSMPVRLQAVFGFFLLAVNVFIFSQDYVVESTIFSDDFTGVLDNWVYETAIGGTVRISNGMIDIDDNGGTTVWYKNVLYDSIAVEYSARCLSDGVNLTDLNCFLMARDRESTPALSLDSASFFNAGRTGLWDTYHSLETYYFGYGANLNTTFNLRRYYDPGNLPTEVLSIPRDGHRVIIASNNQTGLIAAGVWYHFKVVYFKGLVEVWVNNIKQFSYTEKTYDAPYNQGYFGFRTTYSVHAQFDSVRIHRLQTNPLKIHDQGMGRTNKHEIRCVPNPFHSEVRIMADDAPASTSGMNAYGWVRIFDLQGRPVGILQTSTAAISPFGAVWNAGGMPSGTYVVKAEIGKSVMTKAISLAR